MPVGSDRTSPTFLNAFDVNTLDTCKNNTLFKFKRTVPTNSCPRYRHFITDNSTRPLVQPIPDYPKQFLLHYKTPASRGPVEASYYFRVQQAMQTVHVRHSIHCTLQLIIIHPKIHWNKKKNLR